MRNKKLFKSVVIITASLLLFTGCGDKEEPVSAEPTETVSEVDTEESVESSEPVPSPTVEPEESLDNTLSSGSEDNLETGEDTAGEEEEQEESESDLGYEIIPMEEQVGYIVSNKANVRSGPSTDYDIVDSMTYGESAVFNGYVEDGDSVWYVIKTDNEEIKMVSKSLVSSEKPQPQQPSNSGSSGGSGTGSNTQPSGGGSQPSGGQPSGGDSQPSGGQPSGGGSSNLLDELLGGHGITGGNDSGIGSGEGAGGSDINWQ